MLQISEPPAKADGDTTTPPEKPSANDDGTDRPEPPTKPEGDTTAPESLMVTRVKSLK